MFQTGSYIVPSFAMAHWGIAYCNGVNYNMPKMLENVLPCGKDAYEFSRSAYKLRMSRECSLTPVEEALIDALQCRYCFPYTDEDVARMNVEYVDAMQDVYRRYPDDVDVACLFAEALMMLRPWKLWDIVTGTMQCCSCHGWIQFSNCMNVV